MGTEQEQQQPLMTVREAAVLLRTTEKGIRNMVDRGKLPGVVRVGRRVLVRREELLGALGLGT